MTEYDELIKRLQNFADTTYIFPAGELAEEALNAVKELIKERDALAKTVNEAAEILHRREEKARLLEAEVKKDNEICKKCYESRALAETRGAR